VELYLNNVWRGNLSITGAAGLPPIEAAGNVLRPKTTVRLSMRVSPGLEANKVRDMMIQKLTENPPYNAKITAQFVNSGNGWCMKDLNENFLKGILKAGAEFFEGRETGFYGEGGSIPFLYELQKGFPDAQIVAMGLLGPKSNAHGPNESINLPYAEKLICSLSHIIASCASN
jgi:acetylornithine deacetylase/succinyl-diaminopimelate desuccinylase-like protein